MPPEQEKVASSPPGRSSLSAQQVHVLVRARRALGVRSRRREFRRIEHDQVESGAPVAHLAQFREGVRLAPLRAIGRQCGIAREVLAPERQRFASELSIDTTLAAPPASAASANAPE